MSNYKDTLSKYKKALNSVENKEQYKKVSMTFLKEINKCIKEADKTSNLHTNFVVKKALDPKNGMDYCNQRGLGLNSQVGATMELGRRAMSAHDKWTQVRGKVISDMKKLKKASEELTEYLATGDWYGVCKILAWTPECDPTAIMKYCGLGGVNHREKSGDGVLAVASQNAGLGAELKLTYEKVEKQLFFDKKQNTKGLDAAVSALKNNATKFLNMPIMPKIKQSFSGGISLDSENEKIKNLKELYSLLTKHPPKDVDKDTLDAVQSIAADLKAEAKKFVNARRRLGRLPVEVLVSEVVKARETPDYDATSGVLKWMKSDLETYRKDFMKKVMVAQKQLKTKGVDIKTITRRTKNTIKQKLAVEYWNYALDIDSLNYMRDNWVGSGNFLDTGAYGHAVDEADITKKELESWIGAHTRIVTLEQAKKTFPVLYGFLNTWRSTIQFCRTSDELFKNWALPAKEIETSAKQYGSLLGNLISAAATRGKNWKPKENIDRLKELKSRANIGWSEIKKAKNNLTSLNIENAIRAVCSRKDCDAGEDIVKKLCEEVNSVAKKYL